MSDSTYSAPSFFLSHVLAPGTPAYGGGTGFIAEHATRIAAGATANSQKWTFPNHLGTHVDVPRHFFDGAASVDEIAPAGWWFDRSIILDVPRESDELVTPDLVAERVPPDTELLLIRTGFEAMRGDRAYWERNPGLSAGLARWCRSERPSLRAIGMDLISVTPQNNKPEGRAAHRAFLDPAASGQPIMLIEDMALAHVPPKLSAVCVLPLRVAGADGGPCTVIAWAPRALPGQPR